MYFLLFFVTSTQRDDDKSASRFLSLRVHGLAVKMLLLNQVTFLPPLTENLRSDPQTPDLQLRKIPQKSLQQ